MGNDAIDKLFAAFMAITILSIVVLVPCIIWVGFQFVRSEMAETFDLRKDEWHCTSSHEQSTVIMAGKVPIPSKKTVCDEWTRIGSG